MNITKTNTYQEQNILKIANFVHFVKNVDLDSQKR